MHTDYCTGFDLHSEFLLPDGSVGKNVIIFGADIRARFNFSISVEHFV